MRKFSLTELNIAASIATGAVVGAVLLMMQGNRAIFAAGAGIVCCCVFASFFRWRVRLAARALSDRIHQLPNQQTEAGNDLL